MILGFFLFCKSEANTYLPDWDEESEEAEQRVEEVGAYKFSENHLDKSDATPCENFLS